MHLHFRVSTFKTGITTLYIFFGTFAPLWIYVKIIMIIVVVGLVSLMFFLHTQKKSCQSPVLLYFIFYYYIYLFIYVSCVPNFFSIPIWLLCLIMNIKIVSFLNCVTTTDTGNFKQNIRNNNKKSLNIVSIIIWNSTAK